MQLLGGIAAVALFVGFLGTLAARALAEREAVNDAAMIAGVIAAAVVQPALNEALHEGDPQAVARFDRAVRDTVLGEDVVRVKLWRPDGRILYADEPQLVGRTFALSDTERTALERRETHAEISDLEKSENAFEPGDRLVEVYRPVSFPDGSIALFEIYLSYAPVGSRTTQLWTGFAGVTAASLLLFVLLVTPIVWHLTRRVRAAERQRTALLERAVEASTTERRRIAANLHDGPVQDLAASSFAVAGAAAAAATRGDQVLARELGGAAANLPAGIRSLRTLLVDIYPPGLDHAGIVAALTDLAQGARREDLVVQVDLESEERLGLGSESARVVYRVAQECLRNAVKHAGPATLLITLRSEAGDVVLDVVDDGVGFAVDRVLAEPDDRHFGLRLLGDHASRPGTRLEVATGPGRGTHWRLVIAKEYARQ